MRLSFRNLTLPKFAIGIALSLALLWGCGDESKPDTTPFEPSRTIGSNDDTNGRLDSGVVIVSVADAGVSGGNCTEGTQRSCADECGVETCIGGRWNGICTAAAEKCNGKDDDCDGQIDETFKDLGLGFSCQLSMDNGCQALGLNVCSENQDAVVCLADPVEPSEEICDGSDNDCDGSIDEGFPNQVCCTETTQCGLGQVCTNGLCEGGMTTPGSGGSSCSSFLDCNGLEECVNGQCREICLTATDCPTGYTCGCPPNNDCIIDVCLPNGSTGSCTNDSQCGANQVCLSGQCQQRGMTCYDNIDCPSGQECDLATSACVETGNPGSGSCVSDFDCDLTETCENGRCVESGGSFCLDDLDCPINQICDFFTCIPDTSSGGCIADYECNVDEICQNGACITPGIGSEDFCDAATVLDGSGSVSGSTFNRVDVYSVSCGSTYSDSPDAVFVWRASQSSRVTFDTNGSSFDTTLAVLTACDGSGLELECGDDIDYPANTQSSISLNAVAGQMYYIVVSGFGGTDSGSFVLNYETGLDCTLDSDCGPLQSCDAGACVDDITTSICDEGQFITTGSVSGDTSTGSDLVAPSCATFEGTKDRIYEWLAPNTGTFTMETTGDTNTLISVFSDCQDLSSELACDDDSGVGVNAKITLDASGGNVYYVSVSAPTAFIDGTYELTISPVDDPTDPECSFDFECQAGELCENGVCMGSSQPTQALCDHFLYEAIYGSSYPMEVQGSLSEDVVDNCGNVVNVGGDADFRWFPVQNGNYTIYARANSDGEDVSLALYTDCAAPAGGEELACINSWISGEESIQVTADIAAENAYRIVVSGRSPAAVGTITLSIECDSGACAN